MRIKQVHQAGGIIYAEPGESQGCMYGFGFIDVDGVYYIWM